MKFGKRILGLSASAALVFTMAAALPSSATTTHGVTPGAPVGSRYFAKTYLDGKSWMASGVPAVPGALTITTTEASGANAAANPHKIVVTGQADLEFPGGDTSVTSRDWSSWIGLNIANSSATSGATLTIVDSTGAKISDWPTGDIVKGTGSTYIDFSPATTGPKNLLIEYDPDGATDSATKVYYSLDFSGVTVVQPNAAKGETAKGTLSIPVGTDKAGIVEAMKKPESWSVLPTGLNVEVLTESIINASIGAIDIPAGQLSALPDVIEAGKTYTFTLGAHKMEDAAQFASQKHPILYLPSKEGYQVVRNIEVTISDLQVEPKPVDKQDPSVIVMNNINSGWKPSQAKDTILSTANNFPHDGISDFTGATVSEIYLYRGDLSAIKSVEDFRKIATEDLTAITDNDVMMENRTYVAKLSVPETSIKEGYTNSIIVAFKAQKSTFDNTTGKTETVVKDTSTGSTATVAVADELVNDINGTSGKAKAGKISNDSGKDIATFSYVSTGKTVTPTQVKAASDALSKLVVGKSTDKATDKAIEDVVKDIPNAATYTFGSTSNISDFGFKVELTLNDLPSSLGSNPTLFHMVNGKAVNMGKVNISGGSAVFTITGFSDYFLVKGLDELSAGEGATDSASDVVAETTTAAPAETAATTTAVAETTAAVIETVAPVATTTAAAANPTTGNAPIALAVIPVAIAAAAVVAKKIVK